MSSDPVRLTPDPITLADARFVLSNAGDAGGVAVFLGTTRGEKNADGRTLVALDYEAFEPMALAKLNELAADARRRWPVLRLVLLHRVGRVDVGAASVVIAVSTPHRAEAFEACRWLIDTLKQDVPIWKREVWDDGGTTWVDGKMPKSE